jgi:hypothetical protein
LTKAHLSQRKLQEHGHQINLKKNLQINLITREKYDGLGKKDEHFGKKEEFNRTVQQRTNTQSSTNFTQIKKTLKNIQQRYQTVQQENKYYSIHLDSYVK